LRDKPSKPSEWSKPFTSTYLLAIVCVSTAIGSVWLPLPIYFFSFIENLFVPLPPLFFRLINSSDLILPWRL
jgi:hypothetical protein